MSVPPDHELITHLHTTLSHLSTHPYPYVPGPPTTKKRASVALIIRIQPSYSHWPFPSDNGIPSPDLTSFFSLPWVQHGTPEVLFIKRAARKGDRWTSHVALPGGRRDPEDADDAAVAVREAWEEVGVDLRGGGAAGAIAVGNLPQRVVTTSWGKVPLMVLCPYVYILTAPTVPALRLQPTEVASTHWVPLSALLSPHTRAFAYEDVSSRLAKQETGVRRWMLALALGKMRFAAVRLLPAESLYCFASPAEDDAAMTEAEQGWWWGMVMGGAGWGRPKREAEKPLLLWGLTLGIMADFLDMLPPYTALQLWTYPTFTPLDVRWTIDLMSRGFKRRKLVELMLAKTSEEDEAKVDNVEEWTDGRRMGKQDDHDEVGMGGLGSGRTRRGMQGRSAVGTMLEGYYDIVRRAIGVALAGRTAVLLALIAWLVARYRRQ